MEIRINDHIKVFVLQEELNILFPYLKLEFFAKTHTHNGDFLKKLTKHNNIMRVEWNNDPGNNEIIIKPDMTVKELVQKFHDRYGLEIKLFRLSGKVWLEITMTDNWTLEEQNREGEALSKKS